MPQQKKGYGNSPNKHSAKPLKAFTAKSAVALVLSILLAIGGGVMVAFYNTIDSVNYKYIGESSSSSSSQVSSLVNPNEELSLNFNNGKLLNDPMILNIMIFGEDNRQEGDVNGRSDTMVLVSIDNRHKKLKITSFMRDMWVTIPGTDAYGNSYGENKINAAYTLGGPQLSIKTVESNFGIAIDRYAVVDFDSFKAIIDVLGGIDIQLSQDEIDYINWQTYLNGQSTDRYEIKSAPGVVHLNGRQALWYARDRGYQDDAHPEVVISGDDFDRTQRQRNLLSLIMKEFKSASLPQIVQIVSQIGPMITTNLKKDEITTLVANSLTYLGYDTEEYRVPEDGTWKYSITADEQSILEITDWETLRLGLARFIFEASVVE